jgi:hypothetical protein
VANLHFLQVGDSDVVREGARELLPQLGAEGQPADAAAQV